MEELLNVKSGSPFLPTNAHDRPCCDAFCLMIMIYINRYFPLVIISYVDGYCVTRLSLILLLLCYYFCKHFCDTYLFFKLIKCLS